MATWTYPGSRLGLLGGSVKSLLSQGLKALFGRKNLGPVHKITEPVLGHARPDDLPLEALAADLKEVGAIPDVSQIEPKRVSVLEQDTFQHWCVRQACTMIQSLFFILTATVTDESVSVVLRHRKSSGCESLRSCVRRQNSEQTSSCHSSEASPPLHGIGSKVETRISSLTIMAVWRVEARWQRRGQPLEQRHGACILGHGYPVGLDTTRRYSSIDSTVAADQESIVATEASSFKNGIEDLAGSAALVRFEFQRIFAARETSDLRCNEPSAPRNMALGTTGIEMQGSLEATQNQRFADADDLGTSLTWVAPAAGYRDPTPNSAMGKRADSTLMQETGGAAPSFPIL